MCELLQDLFPYNMCSCIAFWLKDYICLWLAYAENANQNAAFVFMYENVVLYVGFPFLTFFTQTIWTIENVQ